MLSDNREFSGTSGVPPTIVEVENTNSPESLTSTSYSSSKSGRSIVDDELHDAADAAR